MKKYFFIIAISFLLGQSAFAQILYLVSWTDGDPGYSITDPYGRAYQVNPMKIMRGDPFIIKVNLNPGYDQSVIQVYNDYNPGIILTPDAGGIYWDTIWENTTIVVAGVILNKYTVQFPSQQTGYQLLDESNSVITFTDTLIPHGESFKFRISLLPGYTPPVVTVNGNTILTPDIQGVYSINSITQDYTIDILGDVSITATPYNYGNLVHVTGGGIYTRGSQVTLTAVPAKGYRFFKWLDNDSRENPRIFTATGDISLQAVFTTKCDNCP